MPNNEPVMSPEMPLSDEKTVTLMTKNILGEEPQDSLAQLEKSNNDFTNPYSEATKAANSNTSLAEWNNQQIAAAIFVHLFRQLLIMMLLGQYHTMKSHGVVDDSEEDEIEDELYMARRVQEIADDYSQKRKLDATTENDLKELKKLLEERDELVDPLLDEWKEHKLHQIDQLAIAIAGSDYTINGKKFVLNNKDIKILNKVAKAQEVRLKYPGLIPKSGFPNAQRKADSNIIINLGRIAAAKKYSGEYTIRLGKPPINNIDPRPDKQIHVHLHNNELYYSVQDPMGEYVSTKINAKDMHDVHFAAVIDSLTNPSKPLWDEAKRALYEVAAKKGYRQKLGADDVQGVRVSDALELDTKLAPQLKPFFERSHKEDAELEKKQEAAYKLVREKTKEIKNLMEKNSIKSLEKDVMRAVRPESHEQELKIKSKIPELRPPTSSTAAGG